MVEFKAIVNDVKTGRSYNVAVSGHHANSLRSDLPGNKRIKLLLSDSKGFHEKYPGQRKRVAIRGSAISAEIVQINMAVAEYGPKSIEECLNPQPEGEAPAEN